MDESQVLKFQPWKSAIDVTFWHALKTRKLDDYKLDVSPKKIRGVYGFPRVLQPQAFVSLSQEAFKSDLDNERINENCINGSVKLFNTFEDFKQCDFDAFLHNSGQQLIDDIKSGKILENPSLLNSFSMICFADLKKYQFYYWFCFPAVKSIKFHSSTFKQFEPRNISLPDQIKLFLDSNPTHKSGFLISDNNENYEISRLPVKLECQNPVFAFMDPSGLENNPGWPLRNLLLFLFHQYEVQSVEILCIRSISLKDSILLTVTLPVPLNLTEISFTGWELNTKHRMGPRFVDLSSSMDPLILAENSVDLNLQLMRWRRMENLDLPLMRNAKCVLFGAGTLGCYVSRVLLGWGFRDISFVDNGRVSYSNPVRQPLFVFADCVNGGKFKAEAAAEQLRNIYPSVNSKGYVISIPMPGHPVSDKEVPRVKQSIYEIQQLVKEADIVFLLTDSRESRWLPTVLSAAYDKICINLALGFDTFSLIRHGGSPKHPNRLGCYFCGDITAPSDSLSNRTLDQQCTVARPGLAPCASALGVELSVALLHHPMQQRAPADKSVSVSDEIENPWGLLPHRIFGYLSHYQNVVGSSEAFDGCTACSSRIVEAFRETGDEFILKACQSKGFLETASGLAELQKQQDEHQWELDDWD